MSVIREALQDAQTTQRVPLEELKSIEGSGIKSKIEFNVPSGLARDIRTLRENLNLLSETGKARMIAITSVSRGDGASTVASFLAASMCHGSGLNGHSGNVRKNGKGHAPANTAKSPVQEAADEHLDIEFARTQAAQNTSFSTAKGVLIIDTNLRHPAVHSILRVHRTPGLSDVIEGKINWPKAVQAINGGALNVLSAGSPSIHPADLLTSLRAKRLLEELRDQFKRVVIDMPSINGNVEALRVGQWADGVILVLRSGKTRIEVAQDAVGRLNASQNNVLGVVLNRRQYFIPQRIYGAV